MTGIMPPYSSRIDFGRPAMNSHLMPVMEDRRQDGKPLLLAILPYWPVISFCIVLLVGLGGILNKLDNIQKTVEKTEQQFALIQQQIAQQSDRSNSIANSIIEIRGVNNQQTADLTRLEKQVTELQTNVSHIQKSIKWQPK